MEVRLFACGWHGPDLLIDFSCPTCPTCPICPRSKAKRRVAQLWGLFLSNLPPLLSNLSNLSNLSILPRVLRFLCWVAEGICRLFVNRCANGSVYSRSPSRGA